MLHSDSTQDPPPGKKEQKRKKRRGKEPTDHIGPMWGPMNFCWLRPILQNRMGPSWAIPLGPFKTPWLK